MSDHKYTVVPGDSYMCPIESGWCISPRQAIDQAMAHIEHAIWGAALKESEET